MELNNLENIKQFLNFESEDIFYHLQILIRKKDNPEIGSNSVVVKTYYVTSINYLELKMNEIISLCKLHKARAYINLNQRSFEKTAFHFLKKVTDCILNKDYKSIRKAYDSACGKYSTGDKIWIIDVDNHDISYVDEIGEIIDLIKSSNEEKPNVIGYIPTKNGWHIITRPFNLKQFEPYTLEYKIDIQKNNPTILYLYND